MTTSRLETLQQYLKDSPDDAFILFAIAKEYEKQNQLPEARQYYEKLLLEQAEYIGTYYHLGKLYERLGLIETAFFTYKKGMEVCKRAGDQHAYSELAGAKLNLGDDDDFE